MGILKEGIEGPVLAYQYCLGCKRRLEEIEVDWNSERICQDVQFFDAGYQEHVGGGQTVQFHVWLVALGIDGVKEAGSA